MYFKAFDIFPYRIYVRDKGKIIYANFSALKFMGLTYDEVIGQECVDIFYDLTYLEHINKMEDYFFKKGNKKFSSLKELNRCFNKPELLQIMEYVDKYKDKEVIVSILISISDQDYPEKTISINNFGSYEVEKKRILLKDGDLVKLTSLENSFLFLLARKPGETVTYDEIFMSIDPYSKMNKVSLKSLVFRINKKINIIKCTSMQGYYIK